LPNFERDGRPRSQPKRQSPSSRRTEQEQRPPRRRRQSARPASLGGIACSNLLQETSVSEADVVSRRSLGQESLANQLACPV
jgi:hypothetical protein